MVPDNVTTAATATATARAQTLPPQTERSVLCAVCCLLCVFCAPSVFFLSFLVRSLVLSQLSPTGAAVFSSPLLATAAAAAAAALHAQLPNQPTN